MRFVLVQPDAQAAAEMVAHFQDYGLEPVHIQGVGPEDLAPLSAGRPQAILACLDKQPDEAVELTSQLVAGAPLKTVTVLFCGGTAKALSEAEARFPKASFTRMENVQTALVSLRGL